MKILFLIKFSFLISLKISALNLGYVETNVSNLFEECYVECSGACQAYEYIISETSQIKFSEWNCTSNVPYNQFQALKSLYDATGGNYWRWPKLNNSHWNFNNANSSNYPNPCKGWYGVVCVSNETLFDDAACNIYGLYLAGYNLTGTLPPDIANLTELLALNLPYNHIEGSIPTELGQMTNLSLLNLFNNSLMNTIPSEIGQLQLLKLLNLGNNHLESSIPTVLGYLTDLIELYLYSNKFIGALPSEVGLLKSLEGLFKLTTHLKFMLIHDVLICFCCWRFEFRIQ